MLNPDLVGRTFLGATSTAVSHESIAAFAAVIGESDTSVATPTYAITITLDQSQNLLQESGLDWTRVVHGDQRFDIKRPIIAGDNLRCDSTIESARVMAGNEIVTVRGDLININGASGEELVVSSWSTLVVRA